MFNLGVNYPINLMYNILKGWLIFSRLTFDKLIAI